MNTTKGPWVADKFGVVVATNYQLGLLETICETPRCFALNRSEDATLSSQTRADMARWADRCTENARLLAASPELLAALHDLVRENDAYGGCPQSSPAWAVARAAIAKATGVEPCDVA